MEGGLLLPLPLWTEYSCDIHWGGSEILSAFNVAQGSDKLRYLYCCWQHTYAIKALLCNTQYFYGADSNRQPSNTHNMHLCFTSAILVMTMTMHHNIVCTVSCSLFYMHIYLEIRISFPLAHTTTSSLHSTGKLIVLKQIQSNDVLVPVTWGLWTHFNSIHFNIQ